MGATYETSRRVGAILAEAEDKAAAFLGCEPTEVIFGANMTSLDFTLSRTAGRDFKAGDEILVSSLDHDGGVAPWLELAQDRDLRVQHIELRDDTTLDYDDLASKLTERTRVVAFAWASNAIGTIIDAAARLRARAQRRRARLDRRRPLRGTRADRRRRDRRRRADLLALQVLRAAPGHRLRPHRAARDLAPLQGAPGADDAARAAASRPARSPTSCSPASTRRSTTSTRSAASTRSSPTSVASASASSTRSPTA